MQCLRKIEVGFVAMLFGSTNCSKGVVKLPR